MQHSPKPKPSQESNSRHTVGLEDKSSLAHSVLTVNRSSLARLMESAALDTPAWGSSEMAAIFRHQMAAGIASDLALASPVWIHKLKLLGEENRAFRTFGDLFYGGAVPFELLALIMDFAKTNWIRLDGLIPYGLARMLYFACIAKAFIQTHQRMDGISSRALRDGFIWASTLPWLDDFFTHLFQRALRLLVRSKPDFQPRSYLPAELAPHPVPDLALA